MCRGVVTRTTNTDPRKSVPYSMTSFCVGEAPELLLLHSPLRKTEAGLWPSIEVEVHASNQPLEAIIDCKVKGCYIPSMLTEQLKFPKREPPSILGNVEVFLRRAITTYRKRCEYSNFKILTGRTSWFSVDSATSFSLILRRCPWNKETASNW